jgi:UrcA family protein
MSIKMIGAAAAVAIFGASAGAQAATVSKPSWDDNVVRVKVDYRDLDLGGEAGASSLLQRIRHAARQVCGDRPDGFEWDEVHSYNACMNSAVDRAVASLGNPMVSALNIRGAHSHGVVLASREP